MDKLGGRKFVYAAGVVILGFVLVLTKNIEAAEWLKFAELIGGLYILGNVANKGVGKLGGKV